jgi:acetyl esterase/lipase
MCAADVSLDVDWRWAVGQQVDNGRLLYEIFLKVVLIAIVLAALGPGASPAQLSSSATWAAHAVNEYQVFPNITYLVADNYESKLDIYERRDTTAPQPTLIWIHGGAWLGGVKEADLMMLMPWFEMGWNVVNVEYRRTTVSLAPAAVEDCLCALRYVATQAKQYNFDTDRLVVSGESAGGHLALTTGMIPESAGLDRRCRGVPLPRVAAIVNWYGITDVRDLLDGQHWWAEAWFGSIPNREELARRVSPLSYVRPGLPPILTIHGDADPSVPYNQAVRLHEALSNAGVPNQLLTIPKGKHGGFTAEERTKIFSTIRDFLARHGMGE